jgi:hypothetical protein
MRLDSELDAAGASAVALGSMLGEWLLGAVARRVSTRTVADAEAYGSLPGDALNARPRWSEPAASPCTPPERVWPWLAQMGYGRGGWHTPQGFTSSPTGGCSARGLRSPREH